MKKAFLLITAIILIIIFCILGYILQKRSEINEINYYNKQYQIYLNKEVYGTEVATIINKAIEQNEENEISKDENGYYIENDTNSIKINLKMITIDQTYPMELIYSNNMQEFVKNFSIVLFKCTNIEYHKQTGKISKITFEQIEK